MRVENFGVKRKHPGGFQKGDMSFAILVLQNIHVVVLPPFEPELFPIFYTETCIRDFKKRSHKSFSMATLSANNDDYCQVIVADGNGKTITIQWNLHKHFMKNTPKSRMVLKGVKMF